MKRRENLERIFLHDIVNTASVLQYQMELFPSETLSNEQLKRFKKISAEIKNIMDDIQAQRDLLKIENNELILEFTKTNTLELIQSAVWTISSHNCAIDKVIIIDESSKSININTDERLIRRVLVNLLKNALEASKKKEIVKIGCNELESGISFWIQNNIVLSENIKSQIFQRSFSTKGTGRGLGTYSSRIIVEDYLNGRIYFESTEKNGTIFYVVLDEKKKEEDVN
ncbi:MAG: HAMP domain-containing histidine kinase [Asgard group archaeon]|nr:HAMP domain-containing histidine kinase [Asgard group archaeon]